MQGQLLLVLGLNCVEPTLTWAALGYFSKFSDGHLPCLANSGPLQKPPGPLFGNGPGQFEFSPAKMASVPMKLSFPVEVDFIFHQRMVFRGLEKKVIILNKYKKIFLNLIGFLEPTYTCSNLLTSNSFLYIKIILSSLVIGVISTTGLTKTKTNMVSYLFYP